MANDCIRGKERFRMVGPSFKMAMFLTDDNPKNNNENAPPWVW